MGRRQLPNWLTWSGAILAGLALAVLIGGWIGLAVGALVVLPARRGLRRLEPAGSRRERQQATRDLPYLADLLAATLRAGSPVDRAVQVVAEAVPGPAGDRLARVAHALALGVPPERAWAALADLPDGGRMVTAVSRSTHSGAALAGAFTRIADDLRAGRTNSAEAATRRSAVLVVLPLGLCFLPAFVFAGVVPVIVAVLGDVLH